LRPQSVYFLPQVANFFLGVRQSVKEDGDAMGWRRLRRIQGAHLHGNEKAQSEANDDDSKGLLPSGIWAHRSLTFSQDKSMAFSLSGRSLPNPDHCHPT
jgi:hypothetical protein